jgi:hypothetical protein
MTVDQQPRTEETPSEAFEQWSIVELMGHRRLAGRVSEANLFGTTLIRIDVPKSRTSQEYVTQFYAPSALYCLTPTTEEIARGIAADSQPRPVQRWELEAGEGGSF